mgnify:FL=1
MFKLESVRERIWHLSFDNNEDLAMTFLRYQETYESPNETFRMNPFTIAEFKRWYENEYESFSYVDDWNGFNIPTHIIADVRDRGIDDVDDRDRLMASVLTITGPDAYLVGSTGDATTVRHELLHALYFVEPEYAKACEELIRTSTPYHRSMMELSLKRMGYAPHVYLDEIQATLANGELHHYKDVDDKMELDSLAEYFSDLALKWGPWLP